MTSSIATIVLWLFVINLGIAFGAGLFESRIVVPQWLSRSGSSGDRWNAEAAREASVGLRFWVYVTTGPLTLLTLAGFALVWSTPEPVRGWWLMALAAVSVDRVLTFAYFIPTMIRLMEKQSGDPGAAAKARQWVNMGYVRHAATLVAWLASLKALSMLGGSGL